MSYMTELATRAEEAERDAEKWMDAATYDLGGAPQLWSVRAQAAERKLLDLGRDDWYCGATVPGSFAPVPTYRELMAQRDAAVAALKRAHDLCMTTAPKQAVGEVLAAALSLTTEATPMADIQPRRWIDDPWSAMTMDEAEAWRSAMRVAIETAWRVSEESMERGSDAHVVAERLEAILAEAEGGR